MFLRKTEIRPMISADENSIGDHPASAPTGIGTGASALRNQRELGGGGKNLI
jgi:hypothetical protein